MYRIVYTTGEKGPHQKCVRSLAPCSRFTRLNDLVSVSARYVLILAKRTECACRV